MSILKTILESAHEHLDTHKILFLFNEPFKIYGSLYFTTFSMKPICHTFASFGTTLVKSIESIFLSFYKDILKKKTLYGPFLSMVFNCLKARPTSWRQITKFPLSHPGPFKSDWLLNFFLFLTNSHCKIVWITSATDYFPKLVWSYQNY